MREFWKSLWSVFSGMFDSTPTLVVEPDPPKEFIFHDPTTIPPDPLEWLPDPYTPTPGIGGFCFRYKCPWCGELYETLSTPEEWKAFVHTHPCKVCGKSLLSASKITVQPHWDDAFYQGATSHSGSYSFLPWDEDALKRDGESCYRTKVTKKEGVTHYTKVAITKGSWAITYWKDKGVEPIGKGQGYIVNRVWEEVC